MSIINTSVYCIGKTTLLYFSLFAQEYYNIISSFLTFIITRSWPRGFFDKPPLRFQTTDKKRRLGYSRQAFQCNIFLQNIRISCRMLLNKYCRCLLRSLGLLELPTLVLRLRHNYEKTARQGIRYQQRLHCSNK